jgi:hypothetical protein
VVIDRQSGTRLAPEATRRTRPRVASARLAHFFVLLCILLPSIAVAQDWVITLEKRSEETKKERWSLATHLSAKAASSEQDIWYRFFLGKRDPKPRLELVAGGLGQSIRELVNTGSGINADQNSPARSLVHVATGYNLRLAFNHFVSGTTGIPTFNIVPNFYAEVLASSFGEDRDAFSPSSSIDASSTEIGGGFRLFGSSHADNAIYLDYVLRRQWTPQGVTDQTAGTGRLQGYEFESWLARARVQFYIMPVVAVTGSIIVDENIAAGHERDKRLELFEQSVGGFVDLAMFRLSYDYRERTFLPRREMSEPESRRVKEFIHQIGLGFVF